MTTENPRRILFYLAVLGVIAYGALLIENMSSGVGGSDSSGYANTARLILSARAAAPVEGAATLGLPERLDWAFIPLAFEPGRRPRTMVPLYAPGFPLHIAAAALVAGWDAGPFVVSPIAAILCIMLTYLLGRELGLSRPFAFAGTAILASCAVFLFQAVQPMSDVVAAVWATAAVLFALKSRRSDGWALLAGAAFGIAVLVRPTNLLLVLPLVFAISWRPKAIALFLAGGTPAAAFLLFWNRAAYGGFFRTGYGGIGEWLAAANFGPRVQHYAYWLAAQLSPLVPLGWIAATVDRRIPGRDRALLSSWFAAFFCLYCFWGPDGSWWYTRYMIPALPALILASLLAARDLIGILPQRPESERRRPYRGIAALLGLALVIVFELGTARRLQPLRLARGQAVFREACLALAEKAPERGVVVSMEFSGAVRFYTDLAPLRWDRISPEDFATVRAKADERGLRVLALLLPQEIDSARAHAPGRWSSIGRVGAASLWELPPER